MAEERIGITKFKDNETPDFELCAYKLMTRQDAIERIGKAISDALKKTMDKKYVAEAALNSLLEDK